MTYSDTATVDLFLINHDEALRIASGIPGPDDRWAPGFPRGEDSAPAARMAAGPDPGPFGSYRLVPRAHGLTVGTAGFFGPPDESGEVTIGYGMIEPERGRGYGTEAVAALLAVCRAHGGVSVVNADTDPGNIASQRVLAKNGFEHVRSTDKLHFFALRLKPAAG